MIRERSARGKDLRRATAVERHPWDGLPEKVSGQFPENPSLVRKRGRGIPPTLAETTNPATKVTPMNLKTPVRAAGIGGDIALILRAAGSRLGFRLAAIVTALIERDVRYRSLCRLATLDERLLRDMGLTRDAVRNSRMPARG